MDNKFKTDLFEAFIAVVELIIDKHVYPHAGYCIVYNILEMLLDDLDMTIDLRKTKPATAQLKELINRLHGQRVYHNIKDDRNDIIGMRVVMTFPEGLLNLKTNQKVFEKNVQVQAQGGKDMVEEQVSLLALKWLQQECNSTW
jgi:hypothetical protein